MDIMESLQQLVEESQGSLPYKTVRVREELDFTVVPGMVYSDGPAFIRNCLEQKEQFVCDLFNSHYEKTNPNHHPGEPRFFRLDDFSVLHRQVDENKRMVVITLPEEFMGSMEFLSAYVIAYRHRRDTPEDIQLFGIADSAYGWRRIYRMAEQGEPVMVGGAKDHLSENIEIIRKTAFCQ